MEVMRRIGSPQVVTDAAAIGRRELLIALRDRVAGEIDKPDIHARDLAALSKRLVDIAVELESFNVERGGLTIAAELPDEAWSAE